MLSSICSFGSNCLPSVFLAYKPVSEVYDKISCLRFEIEVDESGDYFLRFWLLGHRDYDNNYIKNPVYVNDVYIGMIDAKTTNWHFASIDNVSNIYLNKGTNKIDILGDLPNIPNIQLIEAVSSEKFFCNDDFLKYLDSVSISDGSKSDSQRIFVDYDEIRDDEDSTLYDYSYSIRQSIDYTFLKDLYYKSGDEIFIEGYPIDDCPYVLELFHAKNPEENGWVSVSNKYGQACIQGEIKESGRYYFRARTQKSGEHGFCSLNINGAIYDSIPIYSCNIPCDIDVDKKCNIFTCNSGENDPVIVVLDKDYNVLAFDDDYGGDYVVEGSFDWGYNARVQKEFKEKPKYISVSSYNSYKPIGLTDIYIGCKDILIYILKN